MSRKKDISREEIAKQFLLPERQSKIDTLLKQDGQAYCICRSSDSSRFMIACDACEEWYHGDCMKISEKEAKLIKQYFCIRCKEEDPSLITRWKTKRERDESAPTQINAEDRKSRKRKDRGENKTDKKMKKCGECMGCYRTEDCGRCDVCSRKNKHGSSRNKERCKQRVCVNSGAGIRRKRRDSSSDREQSFNEHLKTEYPRQCYGPKCVNSARYGSKYCSDQCGRNLAKTRILQILPQRLQEWALSPSAAEEMNIKVLDQVRKQQVEVHHILQELDKRHRELDFILERAKNATIDPNQDNENDDDSEISTFCVTCGHEIHSRTAIKHMEKCFNKYESQASFGSVFKTRIEGNNMFCDFYNPVSRTYCKRLRVLCPEHCKDPKIGDFEVCGCPLVINVFSPTGEFCRAPKKSCTKHYVWEKLRRAEVDLERVRQWLKMDELLEKERQIRTSMANRAGVLALMLHRTYNHELMERITKAQGQQSIHEMSESMNPRYS
ncbi:CXXC-type zinc finger protein 1 [Leptinotarsa decemlineata]|uniref:CXXC-type zinc finger protein 1 n=1 Tax=Leptinotarsa decemlineata TaxID=7539 RepID=UPI000C254979|nr:CXXC-type zinc finger protein 1-like [Leptinotarsa decemlineata]